MGTNYYVATDPCEHCNRYDKYLHIGKSSFGWSFHFRGYKNLDLVCWQQWKYYLQDKHICDENNKTIIYTMFVEMIEGYKHPNSINPVTGRKNLQHNAEARLIGWFDAANDWDDEQGYSFTSYDFC